MRTPPNYSQVRERALRKGKWTSEEDNKLAAYIKRYGIWNWSEMPKAAGLLRSGKSCRLRWMNYLKPDVKRGNFSKEEEENILQLHDRLGNKWATIAKHLPGRTDNEIKNFWHTHLKKRTKMKKNESQTSTGLLKQDTESHSATVFNEAKTNLQETSSEILVDALDDVHSEDPYGLIPMFSHLWSHPVGEVVFEEQTTTTEENISNISESSEEVGFGLWEDQIYKPFAVEDIHMVKEDNRGLSCGSNENIWFQENQFAASPGTFNNNEAEGCDFWVNLFMHPCTELI